MAKSAPSKRVAAKPAGARKAATKPVVSKKPKAKVAKVAKPAKAAAAKKRTTVAAPSARKTKAAKPVQPKPRAPPKAKPAAKPVKSPEVKAAKPVEVAKAKPNKLAKVKAPKLLGTLALGPPAPSATPEALAQPGSAAPPPDPARPFICYFELVYLRENKMPITFFLAFHERDYEYIELAKIYINRSERWAIGRRNIVPSEAVAIRKRTAGAVWITTPLDSESLRRWANCSECRARHMGAKDWSGDGYRLRCPH